MTDYTHVCEECGAKATFSKDANGHYGMYKDCTECGKRNGMRFETQFDSVALFRYGHKGEVTTYEKVRNRPRGI
jgi:DNA replicative helicase MCM subunit Mcm2 (Cdc46/Mcm family)